MKKEKINKENLDIKKYNKDRRNNSNQRRNGERRHNSGRRFEDKKDIFLTDEENSFNEVVPIKFEELKLSKGLLKSLEEIGYKETTPIQAQTIPFILEGKDIIGQSQTGTGKTASYGLPIIEKIDKNLSKVQALILCPTRELAIQVSEEIRKFTKYQDGAKCLAVYGGEPIERQILALKKGVKIVIGTPGRVMDHMRRKTLKLDNVKMIVLDEADEMLNIGFEEDIKNILDEVPIERQTILFSATMNQNILNIAKKYLKEPKKIQIKAKELTVDKIEQITLELKNTMKDEVLMRLMDFDDPKKALVFCNTKRKVDNLIDSLKLNGYKAEALHGDIKQSQRDRIIRRFKDGEFQILVATDVAARGIDIDKLELVINYDIPQEEEYYVHRIGRTGRNGNIGKAYTFVVGKEKGKICQIKKYANTEMRTGKIPTIKDIEQINNKKIIDNLRKEINEFSENTEEEKIELIEDVLDELKKDNIDFEKISKVLLNKLLFDKSKSNKKIIKNISKEDFNNEQTFKRKNKEGIIKLFLNLGRIDKIMVKDIVGSITSNCAISGSEIGKINIMDKFSFVEVPNEYVEEIIYSMKNKQIKGHDVNIEISNS